ncbi:PREDICTED: probable threonine--tRNA ligase 2, cytoplasmic isoform X1 [Rhinopithecus bieti]|uniref:probable threonine--tRNA ligase 2, cytoplasmic isoform X1 n=1 Tax=Rhinopithecus bieti TaxID=61621 RepID=UPI00083BAA74|nr:PREDICTED: probable threonine--tRNA ligase 2, cytoplasmic isoform X1 [Rhinopithecus bieti]
MSAETPAAEAVASRLERQEEDIRWLWAEVQRLRDEQLNAPYSCQAEGPCLTREVAQLRAENRDLRHRLCRLRLCLAEELSRQATLGSAELAGAQEAGAQVKQPIFIKERLKLFEILKKDHQLLLSIYGKKEDTSNIITVRVADGQTVQGEVWKTTPYQVAAEISQELAEGTVIAKVNGELWDLDRPLEGNSSLELLTFDNEEAQAVYWHSSAHILGEAMELYYGGHLCYGPPIENGFYYDMFIEDRAVSSTELSALENICKAIVKEKQPFERLEVSKEILLEMFKYNKFKCRILNEKVDTATTTVYRCGPLIDLCKGPHVRHTGKIKTIKIFKNSSTYWEGNPEMETLQRIYGISFPDNKMMRTWEKFQEEAKNRDHRKIGKEQELFFFHDLSPGSCFFLPRGAFIYNTLTDFIRILMLNACILKEEYHKRDFMEVLSPNMYNSKLWEASGHWQHYSENMFTFEIEKDTFALKPMNCPGHCLMFAHRPRSWREMPMRFADFGVLHRNELSGTLSGLTRVRRFQQDDAHIFCTVEQIEEEIKGCLQFLQSVYSTFGFSFQLNLSTRPENFLGEIEMWNEAEKQLQNSLMEFGEPWKMNPGDGAFYGPKIDIKIKDAIGRYHQCATIQLDFQLPIRFNLTYVSKDGDDKKRPVIIHRAILGSVERMIAILSENYGGKWPFWLSPRQVMVIPVGPTCEKYALQVSSEFFEEGFMADVDLDHNCTLNKKIRNAQLAQYNFILVVGEKEKINNAVNVRTRDNKIHGEILVTSAIDKLKNLKKSRTLIAEEDF